MDGCLPKPADAKRVGGFGGGRVGVDSNFTAGWEDTQSAPGAPAYTQCLIAVNCGAVFSTQTNLGLAALTTGRVFLFFVLVGFGADVRVSVSVFWFSLCLLVGFNPTMQLDGK